MKYFVGLDTNVVVSALFKRSSTPGAILEEALGGCVIPLLHDDILEEYNDVLHRPKFKFDGRDVDVALAGLIKRGIFVDAAPVEDYVPDPDDVIFYQVVMEARKAEDAYLVTGNLKHFPGKTFVVTPKEMLDIINGNDRRQLRMIVFTTRLLPCSSPICLEPGVLPPLDTGFFDSLWQPLSCNG